MPYTEVKSRANRMKIDIVEPAGMLLVQLAYVQQMGQVAMKLLQR
jgi:hypothetical protein